MSYVVPVPANQALRVSDASAAAVRVAISPMATLYAALVDALAPGASTGWAAVMRDRARGLDPGPLAVFGGRNGELPSRMLPLPDAPKRTFADELRTLRATPPDLLVSDIGAAWRGRPLPPEIAMIAADPGAGLERHCRAAEAFWDRLIRPSWPRIERVLEREVLLLGRTMARDGIDRALAELHPRLAYADGQFTYHVGRTPLEEFDAAALTLLPLASGDDRLLVDVSHPDGTSIGYAARGMAELWDPSAAQPGRELGALLGRRRAAIALELSSPATTTDLAVRLGLAPSTVSRHLAGLAGSGLVDRARCGAHVYYRLSERGESLLDLF